MRSSVSSRHSSQVVASSWTGTPQVTHLGTVFLPPSARHTYRMLTPPPPSAPSPPTG
jgi:hypothetical protein